MEQAPDDEAPSGTVPDAGYEENNQRIEDPAAFFPAAEGQVDVIAQPCAKRDMLGAPEVAEVRRPVGAAEIQGEPYAKDEAEADGDEGVAREIEIDPHSKGEALQPDVESVRGIDPEFFGKEAEVVGDNHLVGEAEDDPAEGGVDVLRMDAETVGLDLGEEKLR